MTQLKDMSNEQLVDAAYAKMSTDGDQRYLVGIRDELLRRMGDGWVSVEDRLPEPNSEVLAWCQPKFVGAGGFCLTARFRWDAVAPLEWVAAWDHERIDIGVTHWRALPTPPKEDK